MPRSEGIGARVVREYLAKFPDIPTRTLARKLFKENHALWPSFVACHNVCRRIRGVAGKKARAQAGDKSAYRAGTHTGFAPLPEPITQLEDWHAHQLDNVGVWLVISDLHIPFHSVSAIKVALGEAKKHGKKLVGILINGDLADCHAISWFHKDPRTKDFPGEVGKIREFFWACRKMFPKARIVWKWGNHEERYDQYMQIKCSEFLGIAAFEFKNVVGADDYGVEVVKDKQPVKLGKLWTIHGHEYGRGFTDPVNAARTIFLRARVSAICGHYHKSSQHSAKDLGDNVVSCWAAGCLCDLRPEYRPINDWNHGAAMVHVFKDLAYEVENFRVINGEKWS